MDLGLNDADLDKISENDGFGNNNWFNIIKVDGNGYIIEDDLGIYHTYDEAIEKVLEVAYAEHENEYK